MTNVQQNSFCSWKWWLDGSNITKDNHFEGEDLAMYSTFYT